MGKIIPFPVWIIPFPVLKINLELLGSNDKCFVKEVFLSEVLKYHKKWKKLMVSEVGSQSFFNLSKLASQLKIILVVSYLVKASNF